MIKSWSKHQLSKIGELSDKPWQTHVQCSGDWQILCQDRSEFQTTAVPALSPRFCQIVRTCHNQTRSTTTTYYDHLQLSTAAAATVSPQQVEPLGRVFHFQCRHIPAVSQRLAESCHARRSRHVDWSRFDSQNMAWVCIGFVLNAGLCYSCLAFCNVRHLFQPQKCCAWHCLTNLSKLTGWGCHHRAKPCQTLNALHFSPKTYMFFGGCGCTQNAHV